jgi:hypothetical protein
MGAEEAGLRWGIEDMYEARMRHLRVAVKGSAMSDTAIASSAPRAGRASLDCGPRR